MAERILMITGIAGAESCAHVLSKQFQMTVETVPSRKEALAALRRHEYALVVIDESLIQAWEHGDDLLFKHSGLAIPLEINFAVSGAGRLVREVRAALARRMLERELAARAAASSLHSDLGELAAGLLLQSQLALAEPELPPPLAARMQSIVGLAARLGQHLGCVPPAPDALAAAPGKPRPALTSPPLQAAHEAKRPATRNGSAAQINGSYASSAAGNPSAGTRPGSPGL
jgi:hypothetical protein